MYLRLSPSVVKIVVVCYLKRFKKMQIVAVGVIVQLLIKSMLVVNFFLYRCWLCDAYLFSLSLLFVVLSKSLLVV